MKALVQTAYFSHERIAKYLEQSGFVVERKAGKSELTFSGERDPVIKTLTLLRYKYPIGYIGGWTLPDEENK